MTQPQPQPPVTTNGNGTTHALPSEYLIDEHPPFTLGQFSIDDPRPMKVVIVGAGYSGIIAGIRMLQRIPNLHLTIYDANAGVGGTWFLNKYPGLSCDIPSHTYQLTFDEKIDWSSYYSPGPEILAYLESLVEKYKLTPFLKLNHRLIHAQYDAGAGKWRLRFRNSSTPPTTLNGDTNTDGHSNDSDEIQDTADVLFTGLGALNKWSWPDIEGLSTFGGQAIHSARWEVPDATGGVVSGMKTGWEETVRDWGDKKVGVIGVGSSAIQIVAALQPKVAKLVNYVRGKTWLAVPFGGDKLSEISSQSSENYKFTKEDIESFKDPACYKKFRWELECELNHAQIAVMRDTPEQKAGRKAFREIMTKKLAKKPWIADHLIPDFAVGCRRLTPGPGYLEALCEDNVDFVPTIIKRITSTGIETVDGEHRELDVIVCATGYDVTYKPEFPFIGRNGVDLRDKYTPHPKTYMSLTVDGFPNWFQAFGPNAGGGAGSLIAMIEREVDYVVKAILKMQRERLKSMEVTEEAVNDFDEYLDKYFPTTVFGETCKSWYKVGKETGRVVALWPGSTLHAVRVFSHPRWEDYKYEYLDGVRNRFHFLGDGLTHNEKIPGGDVAWYLHEGEVDIPRPGVFA